jgi:predicted transcriptional regulator
MKLNKNDEQVVAALKASPELTMQEIADKTGVPSKKVFKSLKKLFENEMIDSRARKYRLLTDKVPAAKAKDGDAAADVEDTAEAEEE